MRRAGVARPLLLALLVAGNLWQLALTTRWALRPLDAGGWRGWSYVLPYTHTPLVADLPVAHARHLDSRVPFLCADWYDEMRADLAAGYEILAVYNLTSFDENATDPAGIIDRLYLRLGHAEFARAVHLFGEDRVRVNELPIEPMSRVDAVVATLDPDRVRGYWLHNVHDDLEWPAAVKHRGEVAAIFAALGRRFELRWGASTHDGFGRSLHRFALVPWDHDS
jgi:hypothetical protein